jgi:membrane protease YdiL (CAAX protease family)
MAQPPDDHHVDETQPLEVVAEADDVDGAGDAHQEHEHDRVEPLVQPEEQRQQRDQHQVDRHEPQRADDEDHGAPDPLEVVDRAEHRAEDHPDDEQRHGGDRETADPFQHEPPDVLSAGTGAVPRHEVRVAADVEEQRHHLEEPRDRPQACREADRVRRVRAVVAPADDREDPVPRDDDQETERAEEVDVEVPAGPRASIFRHVPERRTTAPLATVVALLAVANVMSNRVLPDELYVPWNLLVAVLVVLIARPVVSMREMGFAEWRRGAAFGIVLLVATAVVMLVAVAMPAFHELYEDRRVEDGAGEMLYQTLVRIPLGTAVLEEVAFRGVLPALLAVRFGVMRACIAASVLFGLWHVLPALSLNEVNPVATDVFGTGGGGTAAAVVFAVIGTMFAGFWFCWIRYRARSILATILAHVASNSVGYTIAYFVTR